MKRSVIITTYYNDQRSFTQFHDWL